MYRGTDALNAPSTLKGQPTFVSEHSFTSSAMRQHRGTLKGVKQEGDRLVFTFTNGVFVADVQKDVMISASSF